MGISPFSLDILRHFSSPPWMAETSSVREVWIFSRITHCNTFLPEPHTSGKKANAVVLYATEVLELARNVVSNVQFFAC